MTSTTCTSEMSTSANDLAASRERIAAAYSPAAFEAAGNRLVSVIAEHLRHVEGRETKVLNWKRPVPLIEEARQFLMAGERAPAGENDDAAVAARVAEIANAT